MNSTLRLAHGCLRNLADPKLWGYLIPNNDSAPFAPDPEVTDPFTLVSLPVYLDIVRIELTSESLCLDKVAKPFRRPYFMSYKSITIFPIPNSISYFTLWISSFQPLMVRNTTPIVSCSIFPLMQDIFWN